jgi:hypothetical protein
LRDCTLTDATPPAKGRWGGAKLNGGTVPMKQLGFSCAEVKAMGVVQGLKAAGYTCAEAKQGGYTCAEAKQAGYTLAEMKQAGFIPRECMQAGFTYEEGWAAGFRGRFDHEWNGGKPPPRIEPRLNLAARALRLRPPPPGEAGRGRRRAAAHATRALQAARRRGEPALPTHARSCAWRPRVAAQGDMTGMGKTFVDSAACPRRTAPRCRDLKSRPLYYGRGVAPSTASAIREVSAGRRYQDHVQDAGRQQEHESAS